MEGTTTVRRVSLKVSDEALKAKARGIPTMLPMDERAEKQGHFQGSKALVDPNWRPGLSRQSGWER